MANLAAAIRELETEKQQSINKHKEEIEGLDRALEVLRKRNTACLKCLGEKGSSYRIVAEADVEWHDCNRCGGSGIEPDSIKREV